jgi:hypothetical protein
MCAAACDIIFFFNVTINVFSLLPSHHFTILFLIKNITIILTSSLFNEPSIMQVLWKKNLSFVQL